MNVTGATVAIASCAAEVGRESEDLQVIAALRRCGVRAEHVAWDDAEANWAGFELMVIRSTWDYPARHREFLAWVDQLPRVLNSAAVLRWNTDKHYLAELTAAGLPVIPTQFIEPGQRFELPAEPLVVKPAVSCSSRDTARYTAGDGQAARDHVERLQQAGRTAMVQPYYSGIEAAGETALLYLAGRYSHAIRRDAVLTQAGPRADQLAPPANVRPVLPTAEELQLAERALSNVPGGLAGLLYGRVDLIPGPEGRPRLLELELTEPTLFLDQCPGSVERFADAIADAIRCR